MKNVEVILREIQFCFQSGSNDYIEYDRDKLLDVVNQIIGDAKHQSKNAIVEWVGERNSLMLGISRALGMIDDVEIYDYEKEVSEKEVE